MSDLSSGACEVIAAIEKCQTDRARLRSLLAEGVNLAVDAGPHGDALAVLPWDLLAEIREALAACPDDFATVTELACCAKCEVPMLPDTRCGLCRGDVLPEGPAL